MKFHSIKSSKKMIAAMIFVIGGAIVSVGFYWQLRPAFSVVANGETWFSSDCYRVKNGFSTFLLAATNPIDKATKEIKSGQFRLMPNISTAWPRFTEKYSSTELQGLECRSAVPIREPFGDPILGDTLANFCEQFGRKVQGCLAEAYNNYVYRDPGFPGKDNCVWTIVPPRSSCSGVKAWWKDSSNREIGD
jgi:hypothetical protein